MVAADGALFIRLGKSLCASSLTVSLFPMRFFDHLHTDDPLQEGVRDSVGITVKQNTAWTSQTGVRENVGG